MDGGSEAKKQDGAQIRVTIETTEIIADNTYIMDNTWFFCLLEMKEVEFWYNDILCHPPQHCSIKIILQSKRPFTTYGIWYIILLYL